MSHFFLPYDETLLLKEIPIIYEHIKDKLNDVETIIEPFCGSSAFSYYIAKKHPNKFKYILNDNNKYLIDIYNIFMDDKKLEKFENFDKNINIKNCPIYKFLKSEKVEITNRDAIRLMYKYKDDNKAFIFIDPPCLKNMDKRCGYVVDDYCYNYNTEITIYEHLYNNNINSMSSKVILIIENNWLLKLLFELNISIEYETNKTLIANFDL